METKRNIKYFTAPPLSVAAIVGWAILAVSIIMISIQYLRFAGIFVAILGVAVVIFSSGGKSNDTDIEYQVTERVKNQQEAAEKKFEVYEKSFLKMLKPIDLRGYDFEATEQPLYYKKGQDGVGRTNYFAGCNLMFTSEKIYIYKRRFSVTDESIDEISTLQYYYNELDHAEIEEKIYEYKKGEHTVAVKYYVFRILKKDGDVALEMCVDYGADIDKYTEQISRAITTRQKELEKRAVEAAERRAAFRAKVEAEKAAIARGEIIE